MNKFKKFFLIVVTLPFLIFAGMTGINIALDPDHILTKGDSYPFMHSGRKYYKNAGVINHYDIKNIAVGGSLIANIIPSEVEAAMGWKNMYSLSLNASDATTVAAIASYALKKHKIENVLFSLQPERLSTIPADQQGKKGSERNFLYLYDDNRLNDLMVFAQLPTIFVRNFFDGKKQEEELKARFPNLTTPQLAQATKDLFSPYMVSAYRDFNRPLFISSLETTDKEPAALTEQHQKNLQDNYNQHIKPVVEKNPSTTFYFIVEPSSYLGRHSQRAIFTNGLKYLVDNLSQYPNVKIFGFANDAFNGDLRLYKDIDHSHIEVSRFVIASIARNSHRLTRQNIDDYIDHFNEIMDNYKVPPIWKTEHYERGNGPYNKKGYISYEDAAALVWGAENKKTYEKIYRSPYLAEKTYADKKRTTYPPVNTSRETLEARTAE
ncbi:MAG: hypothetical protein K0R10_1080 [Alphaproteobacteria bacterium]|jgi:hypothetical protein|nr:hypothetical protein [Alphaproteobacteria bacterium]